MSDQTIIEAMHGNEVKFEDMDSAPPEEVRKSANCVRAAVVAELLELSEAMFGGVVRVILRWWVVYRRPTGQRLHIELGMVGAEAPAWLTAEIPNNDHVPTKGAVAVCIHRAMLEAYLAEQEAPTPT